MVLVRFALYLPLMVVTRDDTVYFGYTKVRPYGGAHMMAGRTFVRCMHRACRDYVPHRLADVVLLAAVKGRR